jgi:hypothetical protein
VAGDQAGELELPGAVEGPDDADVSRLAAVAAIRLRLLTFMAFLSELRS